MASMPDLIFTVLFFFMIVTHMRTETPVVKVETPNGYQLSKPSRKREMVNLYVGKSADGQIRYQIGKKTVTMEQIAPVLEKLHDNLVSDDEQDNFTVNIRADKSIPMGVLTDVKTEVRKAGTLTIRYSAMEQKTDDEK